MVHIALHLAVPTLVAWAFYRHRWPRTALVLIVTMVVDLDHLLVDPIYDPARCSIGLHPLHTLPAIAGYAVLFGVALAFWQRLDEGAPGAAARRLHLVGLGLLIHMALDWSDCLL